MNKIYIQFSSALRQKKGTKLIFEAPVALGAGVNLHCSPRIGAFTYMVSGRIRGLRTVGRYCSLASDVKIGEINHPIDWLSTSPFQYNPERFGWHDSELKKITEPFVEKHGKTLKSSVVIGHDVWIGAGAQILRGVEVGHGAIVAAGAVVSRNVMPYEIVGGIPSQRIRFRFPVEVISRLLQVAWWQYHPSDLKGIDFTDIRTALDQIENLQLKGIIAPWVGDWHELKEGKVTKLD